MDAPITTSVLLPTSTTTVTTELSPPLPPSTPSLRDTLGEDIYEIFTEEVAEIIQSLSELFPQWQANPQQRELLAEIRRGFHTLKGSGRMAGAFALGDFAWAHEHLLNQVVSGQLRADEPVLTQVAAAIRELQARETFFQNAQVKDAGVTVMVDAAEAIIAGKPLPVTAAVVNEPVAPTAVTVEDAMPAPADEVEDIPPAVEEVALPATTCVDDVAPIEWLAMDTEAITPFEPEPITDIPPVALAEVTASVAAPEPFTEVVNVAAPEPFTEVVNVAAPEPFAEVASIDEPETVTPVVHFDDVMGEHDAQAEQESETRLVWQLFWEEFPDQLQALDQHLQRLHDQPANHEILRELEREFHTLKGGARMAQLTALADVSHEAETLLSHLPRNGEANATTLEALQQAVDQLHVLAEQARNGGLAALTQQTQLPTNSVVIADESSTETPTVTPSSHAAPSNWANFQTGQNEFTSLLEQVLAEQADSLPDISVLGMPARNDTAEAVTTEPAVSNSNHETIRLPAIFVDNLIDRVVGLNVQQVRLSEHFNSMGVDVEELVRTVARLRQQVRVLELETEAQIHDGRSSRSTSTVAHSSGAEFDALEMDQYAEIQRISRSLAESLNDLVNLEADLSSQLRKGEQLLQEDMRTTRQIQQDLLDTRLVALTMLVPRLRRLTRQTATELNKQVTLEVEGEDCELDRNLLQNMTAPLEHLIRNAISHGIELPDEREQQGKARTGRVTLSVSRDDAEIVMRFRDDGGGIHRQKLRQRGVELGFIQAEDNLSDNELDRLILRPGFTTAETISQISGRGIGMDVVNSEIKALGGSLQIESRAGQGTEFIIRLPFTLIVNPVLLVDVEGQVFALPITGIQGLARLSGADIQKVLSSETVQLEFAGQFYHLHQLAEQLVGGGAQTFAVDEMFPVVFVKLQEQAVAWIIGHIRGRREVVLQPLGLLFKECRLYSAATVSPDGSVFLVPDMAELARRVGHSNAPSNTETAETADALMQRQGPARIMVVDDSITVRRVTEKFLNTQEYAVSTAKDGMEALERIGEFMPDVVLLDIEMPRMDGFELLGHLRRDPQWQRLPVVMISSRTAPRHREHAMSLGATAFLGKPYQNEILLTTLEQVLTSGHINDGERISA